MPTLLITASHSQSVLRRLGLTTLSMTLLCLVLIPRAAAQSSASLSGTAHLGTAMWGKPQVPAVTVLAPADLQDTATGAVTSLLLTNFGVNLAGRSLSGTAATAVDIPLTPPAGKHSFGYVCDLRGAAQKSHGARLTLTLICDGQTKVLHYNYAQAVPANLLVQINVRRSSAVGGPPVHLVLTVDAQRRTEKDIALLQIDSLDFRAVAK